MYENDIVDFVKVYLNEVVFKESVFIYYDCKIVGYGWMVMIMFIDKGILIVFIVVDNLI